MRRSIRWRLAVHQIVVVSAAMLALAVACEQSVRHYYLERLEHHLAREASLVRRILTSELEDGGTSEALRDTALAIARASMARVTVIDPRGVVLVDSNPLPNQPRNLAHRPEFAAFIGQTVPPPERHSQAVRDYGMHVAVPVLRNLRLIGVVRVSLSFDDLDEQLRGLRTLILGTVLLATALAVAVTLYVTTSITGPIQEVTDVALKMAAGDLTRRVIANPDDEIGQLTRSFNTMAGRLQGMMDELRREREKVARVFSQMADGLVVLDGDARVVLMNPAAEAMLGVPVDHVIARTLDEASDLLELHRLVSEVLACRQERREEILRGGADQQVIDVYAAPVSDQPGMQPGAMLVLHDWTDVWRTERMRREFVANASHELRTPIASVKMMAETLLDGAADDPEVRDRFLRLVAREADRLAGLVADLLDLSQMEAGQWRMEIEVFAVREVAEQVLAKFAVAASERGQEIAGKCPPDLLVLADKRALNLILGNLVENAIKYTPDGGSIWFSAERLGSLTRLSVRDTGIGIPLEHQGRVFERFYRIDKARSREQGGTGLGLSIVKHLVEALNGTIEVHSEPDKGSTFTVSLPAAEIPAEAGAGKPAPA